MADLDDRNPDGPGVPPEDGEISIEFVDHNEDEGHAPVKATTLGSREPETGILEVDADAVASSEEVQSLQEKIAKLEDQLLRRRADFENYKRRQEKDYEEVRRQAAARAVENLLPALDNLDRALESVKAEVSADHLLGLELVRQQVMEALTKLGLEEVHALGQVFDPAFHEAVHMVSVPDAAPMTVTSVYQKGFTLGGKLLRPARVAVNSGADPSQGAGDA
jgi:molecular chaperone GrpE